MEGVVFSLPETVRQNPNFRWTVATTGDMQINAYSLTSTESLGESVLPKSTCFLQVISGTGSVTVDSEITEVGPGSATIIAPGTRFDVRNIGSNMLQFTLVCSPPFYRRGDDYEVVKVRSQCLTCVVGDEED